MKLVTGDTKVVDKGKGDGIFVNTSGIGVIESNVKTPIGPSLGSARRRHDRQR